MSCPRRGDVTGSATGSRGCLPGLPADLELSLETAVRPSHHVPYALQSLADPIRGVTGPSALPRPPRTYPFIPTFTILSQDAAAGRGGEYEGTGLRRPRSSRCPPPLPQASIATLRLGTSFLRPCNAEARSDPRTPPPPRPRTPRTLSGPSQSSLRHRDGALPPLPGAAPKAVAVC